MPSLLEVQAAFSRALLEQDVSEIAGWVAPSGGLDVYRNNVLGNYSSALRDVYPAIATLVGENFFDRVAREYALRYPSRSGDLHDFGETFGEFLRLWEPAAHLDYLHDVAKLEWAMHRVFHAADAEPLDLRALAGVPPESLCELRFELNPAARLIASTYPLLRIWQTSQPGAAADDTVSLDDGGDCLLVIRRNREIQIERLSAGEFAWLQALAANVSLAQAHERAIEMEPRLDLGACLRRHVLGLTLVAFYR